ncbi:MAG: hypothetical protein M3Z00_07250 [Actinomycetota bacterium]|nr:hypothetical protein [Actinomycetota bacterium]
MSADSYADLMEGQFAAFNDRHELGVIEAVVRKCRAELAGQVPLGGQFEMLDRLVRQRLGEMPASRSSS